MTRKVKKGKAKIWEIFSTTANDTTKTSQKSKFTDFL